MGDVTDSRRIGAHCRVDKGLHAAFDYAADWGAEVIQIFTASPRQYAAKDLTEDRIEPYLAAWDAAGPPLVISHASYLLNLASPKDDVRDKVRGPFAAELDRCAKLKIPYLVLHMGSALDSPPAEALGLLVREMTPIVNDSEPTTRVLLETSAGQGSSLGKTFEDVAWALDRLEPSDRYGTCLDTCHVFAAGYDLRGDAYDQTWAAFESTIGIERLQVLHLNDSKGDLGSRLDRHEHIGQGHLGDEPFRRVLQDPRLLHVPCFIETPDDLECHAQNLNRLKALASSTD